MSRYVVDACVAMKWFVPENLAQSAARLLEGAHQLLVPDLLFPEFGNVLWKKIRRGELTAAEGREVLEALDAVPLDAHPSAPLVLPAFEIALATGRTVYDGLYLALAVREQCELVTADERLFNALEGGPLRSHLLWVEAVP